jgi:hypothetical protein
MKLSWGRRGEPRVDVTAIIVSSPRSSEWLEEEIIPTYFDRDRRAPRCASRRCASWRAPSPSAIATTRTMGGHGGAVRSRWTARTESEFLRFTL